jgi:hypothetical protein
MRRTISELSLAIAIVILGWCALIFAFASTNSGGLML